MTEVQEFAVQSPNLLIETFFVAQAGGTDWQTWEHRLLNGDPVEFFYAEENIWLPATVGSWHIDDGSGNAPGADAHFFLRIERGGKVYKYDLHEGLRIRLGAPTINELIAAPKHCEDIEIAREGTRYNNEEWGPCGEPGTVKVGSSWYCASHAKTQIVDADPV